jgi:endonuclease/exonuclease/phosphatase family metal-dependent hydrolase
MARRRRWLGILSIVGAVSVSACEDIDDPPVPVWTPWEQIDGRFAPEVEQLPAVEVLPHGLRVVTYNVLEGIDVAPDAAFFMSDPDLARADVIALQEVNHRFDATESDAAQFARRLNMGFVFVPTFATDDGLQGVALLSRFTMTDIQVMFLPEQTELNVLEQAARAALQATIMTDAGPVRIVNVHLDPILNMPERILQLRPAVLDTPAPVAVLGDFNTNDYVWGLESIPLFPLDSSASTSQAPVLDGYMRDIGYATPTSKLGDTWHGIPEDQRLDSVFTRGLATGHGAVERALDTSDHWPVWLDIEIAP